MRVSPLVALLAVALCIAAASPAQTNPNLLLIIADDLGVDQLSCYGAANAAPTPNINALAAGGKRFTRAFVNPACTPTRGAMLTGRYSFRTGLSMSLPLGAPGIAPAETMLARPVAAAGYATGFIGKWHLGTRYGAWTPNLMGWPYYSGVLDSGVVDYYHWTKVTNGASVVVNRYATSDQIDEALAWIRGQSGPWCLVLSLCAPHAPYHVPPADLHTQNLTGLDPATNPMPFQKAMLEATDREIGRLLTSLGGTTLARTNVVFTGDNGSDNVLMQRLTPPRTYEHGKGSLYEGGTHVPLIVKGPIVSAPGTVSNAFISSVDYFPTLLDLCGSTYPAGVPQALPLDGDSFVSELRNAPGWTRDHVYSEISGTPLGEGYAVRDATHLLIRYTRVLPQHEELYDLAADPQELNNLIGRPMSSAARAAYQRLSDWADEIREDGWISLYGSGCAGRGGVPQLRAQTMPNLGSDYYFYVEQGSYPPGAPWLFALLGFSNTAAGVLALPADLSAFGLPGCMLNTSLENVIGMDPVSGYGVLRFPNLPFLYRMDMYMQAFVGDSGNYAGRISSSQGLHCALGR